MTLLLSIACITDAISYVRIRWTLAPNPFRLLGLVNPSWPELSMQRTNVGCLSRVSKAVSSPSSANLERNLNRMHSARGVAMVATQTI